MGCLESIHRISPNILAFVVLSFFLLAAYKRLDYRDPLSRLFVWMSVVLLPLLLIESLTVLINRQPINGLIPLSIVLHVILFIMASLLAYTWYRFVIGLLQLDGMHKVKRRYIAEGFLGLAIFITLMTPFFDWMFKVDENNVYQRGPLFLVGIIIIYGFLISALIAVLKERRTMLSEERLPFIIFCLLPVLGGTAQALIYGLLTMWSSASFTLVLGYVFLEQRLVRTDYLTGAWSRGTFMRYMRNLIDREKVNKLAIAYIDLDHLKQINDQYGHSAGDEVLKTLIEQIQILSNPFDVCARLGGDEFVWVIDSSDTQMLKKRLDTVEIALANSMTDRPFTSLVSFSWGVGLFEVNRQPFDTFLHEIDRKMYATKRAKTS